MVVYKQNVEMTIRDTDMAIRSMETMANMYTLDPPLVLQEAIKKAQESRDGLSELLQRTPLEV